ncbi:hypothetical protein Taro_046856, partial [Colocasia esculenta]|nr:hypothetical protein [Colocasia esculenta]
MEQDLEEPLLPPKASSGSVWALSFVGVQESWCVDTTGHCVDTTGIVFKLGFWDSDLVLTPQGIVSTPQSKCVNTTGHCVDTTAIVFKLGFWDSDLVSTPQGIVSTPQ